MKTYVGRRTIDGIEVLVDGQALDPRTDVKRLSTCGFEWTYEGDAPAQLALALLCDHLQDDQKALRYHRDFMREVVANFSNDWEMTSSDIDQALAAITEAAG